MWESRTKGQTAGRTEIKHLARSTHAQRTKLHWRESSALKRIRCLHTKATRKSALLGDQCQGQEESSDLTATVAADRFTWNIV